MERSLWAVGVLALRGRMSGLEIEVAVAEVRRTDWDDQFSRTFPVRVIPP